MNRKAQSLLATVLLAASAATAAGAQEMGAGSFEPLSQSATIAPDFDSLLPPEVVPLDPSTASNMSANQAQYRQTNQQGAIPGMEQGGAPGMVQSSAQDMRRQAFESLYGQTQAQQPQMMPQQDMNGGQWRAAQPNFDPAMMMQQPPYGAPAMQGQYPMAMGGNAPQNAPMPTQSQTLSGGVKSQPVKRDIRRAGFSNVLSAATTFGAGALTSAVLMRPNNPWLGAGFYGLTMTGLGNRNSFRF